MSAFEIIVVLVLATAVLVIFAFFAGPSDD